MAARGQPISCITPLVDTSNPKYYALTMYPYPSGDLHMGHWYAMVPVRRPGALDVDAGYNVLFPIGFDSLVCRPRTPLLGAAFIPRPGPMTISSACAGRCRSMGAMFDWEREVITSDPHYYKWTQWFFRKLFDLGLAYKKLAGRLLPHLQYHPGTGTGVGDDRAVSAVTRR